MRPPREEPERVIPGFLMKEMAAMDEKAVESSLEDNEAFKPVSWRVSEVKVRRLRRGSIGPPNKEIDRQ